MVSKTLTQYLDAHPKSGAYLDYEMFRYKFKLSDLENP